MPPTSHRTGGPGRKRAASSGSGPIGAANRPEGPAIWALGGGKGGIGKSFIATNLAVGAARAGYRVVLLDADLGGANLDTFLGCPHPTMSLGDFFRKNVATLDELAMDTGVPGLSLIAGDADSLAAASPHHAQKEKLIRHLRKISASLVIVDLGAGTSFNTLDLFNAADMGLVVTVPEPTAMQNCFSFIKSVTLRGIERRSGVKRREAMVGPLSRTLDPSEPEVQRALAKRVPLIINRARAAQAQTVVRTLGGLAQRFLGCHVDLVGSVRDDPAARRSIQQMCPLLETGAREGAADDLQRLIDLLIGAQPETTQPIDAATNGTPSASGIDEPIQLEHALIHLHTEDHGAERGIFTQVRSAEGEVLFSRTTPYTDPFFQRVGAQDGNHARLHHLAIKRALSMGRIQLPARRPA